MTCSMYTLTALQPARWLDKSHRWSLATHECDQNSNREVQGFLMPGHGVLLIQRLSSVLLGSSLLARSLWKCMGQPCKMLAFACSTQQLQTQVSSTMQFGVRGRQTLAKKPEMLVRLPAV